MNEAKPQDGTTVKGYRTLGPKEISDMNELKKAAREFNALLVNLTRCLRSRRHGLLMCWR